MPDETTSVVEQEATTPVSTGTPEITDDVVKSHPLYKALLAESIERRQKIAELKQQAVETPKPVTDEPKPIVDVDTIAEQVFKRVQEREAQAKQREATIDKVITETKLNPAMRSVLTAFNGDENQMRVVAEQMVKAGLMFTPPPTGGNGSVDTNSIMESINKRLGIK